MDADLVQKAQHGDREAFAALATVLAGQLMPVARKILRDHDLADDATQQALTNIWRDLPKLRDPERFSAWSYRVLVRACHAEGKRERHWSPNVPLLPSAEPIAADALAVVADREQLERGFRRLSVAHRTVLVLHFYLDLPLDKVADICGIPVGTAHSRYHHAIRGMRGALEAEARIPIREVAR